MLFLSKPTVDKVAQFLAAQSNKEFSYKGVGTTRDGSVAPGYGTDHVRQVIGKGRASFEAAIRAVKNWKEFEVGWVELNPPIAPIADNQVVSVSANHMIMWSLNACRIVYTVNEENRFGFAYGTLPDHSETGEERFLIEYNPKTEEVIYDVIAFSNPGQWWGWVVLPIVRIIQNKFRRDSIKLMKSLIKAN